VEFDSLTQQRIAKLQRLRSVGIDPYPARSRRTHTAAQALAFYRDHPTPQGDSGPQVTVAGRLVLLRPMGKATFGHVEDGSGRIQIYLKVDSIGSERYELFRETVDLGDFLQITGYLFQTRTGEITIHVEDYTILAKALMPPPEKWHGLRDVETRYRQRYLDLMANTNVRRIFLVRSKVVSAMRRFLDARGFIEVETPVLQPIYGGAAARPFITHHNALDQDFYLRIATELYLKRLIVAGIEKVYEIGKDFRNEGIDTTHNPEFTMMESYEAYADYTDVMAMVEEMIPTIAQEAIGDTRLTYGDHTIDLTPPWRRVSLRQAILEHTGLDIEDFPTQDQLSTHVQMMGLKVAPKASWGKLVDEIFSTLVQPKLIQPTFIIDYPVELSPFAKKKPEDPRYVERFEAFIAGLETGNAFSELNDPLDQLERFQEQARQRAAGDEEAHPMDEDFIVALMHGMPPTGGLGIGIDRLVMLLTNQESIREVILFPQLRTRD